MTQNLWDEDTLLTADGQIYIGQTAGDPVAATISAGCGFTVTNGPNSITIDTISTNAEYVKISTTSASNSTSVDFTGLSSTYHLYIVEITDFTPATDGTILWLRTSSDNGVTYDDSSGDYTYNAYGADNSGDLRSDGSTSATEIQILGRSADTLGNAANETHSIQIWLFNPSSASFTKAIGIGTFIQTNGNCFYQVTSGQRKEAAAVNAIRLMMNSGNITSGTFTLYGVLA